MNESSEEVSIQPDLAKMEAMVLPSRATESTMTGCPPLSTVARSAAYSLPEFDFTGSVGDHRGHGFGHIHVVRARIVLGHKSAVHEPVRHGLVRV